MNITQIENNVSHLITNISKKTFIYNFLLAYGVPKSTITLLKNGRRNLSNRNDQVILKRKIFFQEVSNKDPHETFKNICAEKSTYSSKPRFVVVTDYNTLLAIDSKTKDQLDTKINDIDKNFVFFLPLAGMEKKEYQNEHPADVKAAERMAKLYDEIFKINEFITPQEYHSLNIFLSRLLFCFFAEDTGIFKEGIFTNSISSWTQHDGSDLHLFFSSLFEVLNRSKEHRVEVPDYLNIFPYVNGGLFNKKYPFPKFSMKSRQMIIESGKLNWSQINPDIFGSMMQAVIHTEQRSGLGMHYTSVPNIMKVIEPLFLDKLNEELNKSFDNISKLEKLLFRLTKIRIFDPACGSGNFLIIAYKEIRSLEIKIIERLNEINPQFSFHLNSCIELSQFYGIELDDFSCEIAALSLWLAEHQMNLKFHEIFGFTNPTLPLKKGGNIICENAVKLEWEIVCPRNIDNEIYVLGNPPYLGSRKQNQSHKEDLKHLFKKDYKTLDYISAWFYKGAEYIKGINALCAFVSTNSICQGEQVSLLWPRILNEQIEIDFAYNGFKWVNNAKNIAGVIVIIIGLRNKSNSDHLLFRQNIKSNVKLISPYLTESKAFYLYPKTSSISNLPAMHFGNMPADGGKLILSSSEKINLENSFPKTKQWIRPLIAAKEFLNGGERWCLWLLDIDEDEIMNIKPLQERVNALQIIRGESSRPRLANIPHLFAQITQPSDRNYILVPRHSSENRDYIPIGFFTSKNIAHDSCLIIPITNEELYVFGILTSKMHMVWVRAVAGRIKSDLRYSKDIVYNNFPFSKITDNQKSIISTHVFNILSERQKYTEKSLAEIYNNTGMPKGLREAHIGLDIAIEGCYRSKPFKNDEERLEALFNSYQKLTFPKEKNA